MEQLRNIERISPDNTIMGFKGDFQVIQNILANDVSIREGKQSPFRVAMVLPGGGQRGVLQGGVMCGLEKLRLIDSIDTYVGVSSGVPAAFQALGGQAEKGTGIYFLDNVHNELFNPLRPWHIFDSDPLEYVMREEKSVNVNYLRSRRPQFFAGITDAQSGKGRFINMKKSTRDPLSVVMASVNLPFINNGKIIEIDGREYIDGTLANPVPITWTLENTHPTDILVVLAGPLDKPGSGMDMIAKIGKLFQGNPTILEQLRTFNDRTKEELKFVTGKKQLPTGVRIAAIYPKSTPIKPHTMDSNLLLLGKNASQSFTQELFLAV